MRPGPATQLLWSPACCPELPTRPTCGQNGSCPTVMFAHGRIAHPSPASFSSLGLLASSTTVPSGTCQALTRKSERDGARGSRTDCFNRLHLSCTKQHAFETLEFVNGGPGLSELLGGLGTGLRLQEVAHRLCLERLVTRSGQTCPTCRSVFCTPRQRLKPKQDCSPQHMRGASEAL